MAPKTKKSPSNKKPQTGPEVTILNNYADFQNYIGQADVPQEPLIAQIDRLRGSKIVELEDDQPVLEPKQAKQNFKVSSNNANERTKVIVEEEQEEDDDDEDQDSLLFKVLDYTLYLIPLYSVHLCLDVLVHQQYSEPTEDLLQWKNLLMRASTALPVFTLLLNIARSFTPPETDKQRAQKTEIQLAKAKNQLFWFQTALFLASIALGMYVIFIANEEGYYFVMKKAPALGTLWVFTVLIMDWNWSLGSLIIISFWSWLRGYSLWS